MNSCGPLGTESNSSQTLEWSTEAGFYSLGSYIPEWTIITPKNFGFDSTGIVFESQGLNGVTLD